MTLQGLAESFSAEGVPVFVADVKGDLSGISMPGSPAFKNAAILEARAKELGHDRLCLCRQSGGVLGSLRRAGPPDPHHRFSEMGPLLLARLMDLNETQEGVLNIVFRFADEQGLLLLDLEDLQAMLVHTAEHAAELTTKYGNVTKATIGTIQRQLLTLDSQGGGAVLRRARARDRRFHAAATRRAAAMVNVLAADKLMRSPKLYATFLLWLLAELFEGLPEVGDPGKPSWCSSSTRRRRRIRN